MTDFRYKAIDRKGQFVTGQLQAVSQGAAVQQLVELGYVPLEAAPSAVAKRAFSSLWPGAKVPSREVTILLQDLALLLRAGLPLDEGLRLLAADARGATTRLIDKLRTAIGGGANFADALASQPATAIPDLIAVVRSAEAAGNLEGALETIARERLKQEQVADRIRAAIRYPIFLFVVSISVLIFFLVFVVPQFAEVVRDFGTRPDPLVSTVIALSDTLRTRGDLLALSLAVALGALLLAMRRPVVRKAVIGPLQQLPLVRGIVVLRRTTLFCRGLGTLLANGVNLSDALRLLNESGVGGDRLAEVLHRVRRGERLVDAISDIDLVPPLAARMLRVGEESGALAMVATRCADYYESKLTDEVDRLTGIVGPAAIIFISAVIGTLIVAIMSTLLSVNQMIT